MKATSKKISTSLILGAILSMSVNAQTKKLIYGSDYTALGKATISVSNEATTIGNIGSSGTDGFKTYFNDAEYHLNIGPQDYIADSKIRISSAGMLGANNESPIGFIDISVLKDHFEILPDYSASTFNRNYTFMLFDAKGNAVVTSTGLSGPTSVTGSGTPAGKYRIVTCSHDKTDGNGNVVGHYWSISIHKVTESAERTQPVYDGYTTPDGKSYTGVIALFFSEPPAGIKVPSPMTSISDFAANTTNLVIERGWLVKPHAGIAYTVPNAIDQTRFFAEGNTVKVSNDANASTFTTRVEVLPVIVGGVSINSLTSNIDLGPYNNLSNSAQLIYKNYAFFSADGEPVNVSNLTIENQGNGLDVLPDFGPVNSSKFNVTGYLKGAVVISANGESKSEKVKPISGGSWINTPVSSVGFSENKMTLTFSEPVRYKAKNGYDEVDQVVFTAATPNTTYNSLSNIDLTSSHISSYVFTGGSFSKSTNPSNRLGHAGSSGSSSVVNDDPSISVYPNPATVGSGLTIKKPEGDTYEVAIYDMSGKQLKNSTYQVSNNTNEILVKFESIEPGIYFINLSNGSTATTKSFVITK